MFFKKKNNYFLVNKIYSKILIQSRCEFIYKKLGVPDTFDGRFDVLILLTIIVIYNLSNLNSKGKILAQDLFDYLFKDLDYTLREMGLGDSGVSIKIKHLVSAYMGRQKSYCESFKSKNFNKLYMHIDNNIFRNSKTKPDKVKKICDYCFLVIENFENFDKEEFLEGNFLFPSFKIK